MGILKESYMETAIHIGKRQYPDGDILGIRGKVFFSP